MTHREAAADCVSCGADVPNDTACVHYNCLHTRFHPIGGPARSVMELSSSTASYLQTSSSSWQPNRIRCMPRHSGFCMLLITQGCECGDRPSSRYGRQVVQLCLCWPVGLHQGLVATPCDPNHHINSCTAANGQVVSCVTLRRLSCYWQPVQLQLQSLF